VVDTDGGDDQRDLGVTLRWPEGREFDDVPDDLADESGGLDPEIIPMVDSPDAFAPAGGKALLPTLVGRLDSVLGSISALSLHIDALSGAINALRSGVTDRLTEYSEALSGMTTAQASVIEEYRHGSERALGELRKSLQTVDETIRRTAGRTDETANDVGVVADLVRALSGELAELGAVLQVEQPDTSGEMTEMTDLLRTLAVEVADIGAVTQQVDASLTELSGRPAPKAPPAGPTPAALEKAIQQGVAGPLGEFGGTLAELQEELRAITEHVDASLTELLERPAPKPSPAGPTPAALEKAVQHGVGGAVAEFGGVLAELQEELQAVRSSMDEELQAVRASLDEVAKTGGGGDGGGGGAIEGLDDLHAELTSMREELTQLKRRVGLRAKSSAIDDEQIETLATRLAGAATLSEQEVDRVADSVVERLMAILEVVPDPEPAPAPARAAKRPARTAKSARPAAKRGR
jgi:chromosome segregation ATPase